VLERVNERVIIRAFLSLRHLHTFCFCFLFLPFFLEDENENEHFATNPFMTFDKFAFVFEGVK
jgi:hypothetical protein